MNNSNNIEEHMLTTKDNPFNPFTQFDEWYSFDIEKGYDTCGYIARVTLSSEELSELDQDAAIDKAIDEIVELNVTGNYIKISNKKELVTDTV